MRNKNRRLSLHISVEKVSGWTVLKKHKKNGEVEFVITHALCTASVAIGRRRAFRKKEKHLTGLELVTQAISYLLSFLEPFLCCVSLFKKKD